MSAEHDENNWNEINYDLTPVQGVFALSELQLEDVSEEVSGDVQFVCVVTEVKPTETFTVKTVSNIIWNVLKESHWGGITVISVGDGSSIEGGRKHNSISYDDDY